VPGLDDRIASLGTGGGIAPAVAVAILLGLRHATDPDHLTALSTLVLADDERGGARRAGRLGLAWGAGHATTLVLLGLPVVLFHRLLPGALQRAAEVAVGVVIVALAVRLLVRCRSGGLHPHGIGPNPPPQLLGRSPAAAFGIGLVHGAGGSAGVGVLLIGAMPGHAVAAVALVLFAGATALSMALVSSAWGHALARSVVASRLTTLAPALGAASLAFGLWYGAAAI
jgi:hypothetical protein